MLPGPAVTAAAGPLADGAAPAGGGALAGVAGGALAPGVQARSGSASTSPRTTQDGEQVEAFFNDLVRELAPASASLGDTSQWIARLTASADPQVRATNHARLHLMLGSRMDEDTHGAVHSLMDAMLACLAD